MLLEVDFLTKRRLLLPIIDVVGEIRVRNSKEDYTDILLNGAVRIIEIAGKYYARLLDSSPFSRSEKSFPSVYFSLVFPSDEKANQFEDVFETL